MPDYSSNQNINESDISLSRNKQRSLLFSLLYKCHAVAQTCLPKKAYHKCLLNLAWIFKRLAWEHSLRVHGFDYSWETMGLSHRQLEQWIPRGSKVIDIGCGVGRWSYLAAKYAGEVTGIDYNEKTLEIARSTYQRDNLEFRNLNIDDDALHEAFDVALAIHLIEHIDDVDAFLRKVSKIASYIIVEVPDFEADWLNLSRQRLNAPFYSDADHVREYTMDILKSQLSRNKWEVIECYRVRSSILALARKPEPNHTEV